MFSKPRLTTVVVTLMALAILNRIGPAKDFISGQRKILGLF